MTKIAPYGSWKSPITTDQIIAGTISLDQVQLDGENIYWLEGRPKEKGRYVIVRRNEQGSTTDVLPAPFNARTLVHEYGGGAYAVQKGVIYFSNFDDQRLYRLAPDESPQALTPESDLKLRYADFSLSDSGACYCVREDHRGDGEAVNTIVRVDPDAENEGTVLTSGADFYSDPRLSPDGKQLVWMEWDHPNMPWDGCRLMLAQITESGKLANVTLIAGSEDESIFQPEWSPEGVLYFVSDRSGWWNLYRYRKAEVECIIGKDAEFGRPQWVFGQRTYAFINEDKIVCTYHEESAWHLALIHVNESRLQNIPIPSSDYRNLQANEDHLVCVTGSPREATAVTRIRLDQFQRHVLQRASEVQIDEGYLSTPQAIEFPTENGLTAHAFYYPPKNDDFEAPEDELPPLLVCSHGGPTSMASSTMNLGIQFWTSRGFAVVDVNYGGSTGYGRAYRERLKGSWGIIDIDDCTNAALYLARQELADEKRLAIRGGSAGGYTTLGALTFREVFAAGASHFGVSDLEALVKETHKFESRYLDNLIGPYPEDKAIYDQRSPIHHTDRLSCPVILLQGLEDKIVLPNQAEMMVDALREKGIPVAYVPFEGEQHGFRQAKNIKRALESELYFYSRVLKFELAESVEPVEIENLD